MSVIKVRPKKDDDDYGESDCFIDREGDLVLTAGSPGNEIFMYVGYGQIWGEREQKPKWFGPYKPVRIISIEVEEV